MYGLYAKFTGIVFLKPVNFVSAYYNIYYI